MSTRRETRRSRKKKEDEVEEPKSKPMDPNATSRHFLVTTDEAMNVVEWTDFLSHVKGVTHVGATDPEMENAIEIAKAELKSDLGNKIESATHKMIVRVLS